MFFTPPIFFLLVHQGTIAQLFTKKKFPLHNPFKKVQSPKIFFARLCRYNDPTFYEKKKSHFTIPLRETITRIYMYVIACFVGENVDHLLSEQKTYIIKKFW